MTARQKTDQTEIEARAEALLEELDEGSAEVREAALVGRGGAQIAASDGRDWSAATLALWRAAEATEGAEPTQVHVGTAAGEVLSVRDERMIAIATSERFALASLILSDLRAMLRQLGRGSVG